MNPRSYSAPHEFLARRLQYQGAGVAVDDLDEVAPEGRSRIKNVTPKLHRKAGILRRAQRLARVLREWHVDVIDSHLESAGLVSVLACRMTRKPVSMTMYCGGWSSGGSSGSKDMTWPWTTRVALRYADGVLTDSQIRSQQMSELVGRQERKFVVIPNGIPQPQSERSRAEMRQVLGLPRDRAVRVIAQIGRFTEYKGQDVLLRAARKILDCDPNAAFLMVGFGREEGYGAELKRLAEALRITERVVMTEYPGPIGDVWQAVDIHAHASLFDSLPILIAEGMSLGKPAVVTSAGGIPEIVKHGETGLVVPPGDADALANGLLKVLGDEGLAARLGRNARRRYEELYQPDTMVRSLESYFAELAKRRPGSLRAAHS